MNDFEKVKAEVDIIAEIERRDPNVKILKIGENQVRVNPSPIDGHNDNFNVKTETGEWFSHSIDKGGSVIDLVMHLSGCSELEALEELAENWNIPLERDKNRTDRRPPEPDHIRIFEAAADYYHQNLMKNKSAIAYQTGKRKHQTETLKHFRVGFADGKLGEALVKQGFTPEQIAHYGLTKPDGKDGWKDFFPSGVYIYPHLTKAGKVGRFTLKDPNGEYKFQLPKKHWMDDCLFYNMAAFNSNELILAEGENDILSLYESGCQKAAAIDGSLSEEQAAYLLKWVRSGKVKTLHLCFDNDPAGTGYMEKLSEALKWHCVTDRYIEISHRMHGIEKQKIEKAAEKKADKEDGETAESESKEPKIIKARQVCLYRVPFDEKYKDIDDFLKAQADRPQAVKTLRKSAKPLLKSLKDVIADHKYWTFILYGPKKIPEPGEIGELIFDYFSQTGRFYMDINRSVCCLYYRHKIYDIISSSIPFTSLLYNEAGLISSKSGVNDIVTILKAKTFNEGEHIRGRFWIHTDHNTQTVWFNLCNERNEIIKLSPGNIEIMKNGTNADNVMLVTSPIMEAIPYLPETGIPEAMNLLKEKLMNNFCCATAYRYYLACVLINTLLIQFTESRGINKDSGNSSSGKSATAKYMTTLIYGENTVGTGSAAASYSTATQNPLIVEDNLENRDISKDMKKFLLLAGTGGLKSKRDTATASGVVYEKLCTQVMVTSIEPFTDDELVNRTVDIEFDRDIHANPDFPGEMAAMSDIAEARNPIWNGIFRFIAHEVLPGFRESRREALKMLATEFKGHSKDRLDELFSCLYIILKALVKYIPHPEYSADGPEAAAKAILKEWIDTQHSQQNETLSETNIVLNLLEVLVKEYLIDPKTFEDDYRFIPNDDGFLNEYGKWSARPKSVTFEVATRDLHAAFLMLRKNRNQEYHYRSPRVLGKRISDSKTVLLKNGWTFEQEVSRGGGIPVHRFTKYISV